MYFYFILSIISGVVLSLPWYDFGSGIILFFVLCPLLYIEDSISVNTKKSTLKICIYSGLTFLVWGISSGWWLCHATVIGTVFLIILNTLFYLIIILFYHLVKKRFGRIIGYISLVSFWVAFEYIYLNSEFSVLWLNLGNGLSHNIKIIQ